MNQSQIKYARERATAIHTKRTNGLQAQFTTPALRLSTEEKLAALKAGAFRTDPKAEDIRFGWDRGVIFKAEKAAKYDKDGHVAAKAALDATFAKLMDELILGDNEAALAMLRDFEAQG
jgi:hypothetical protein